MEITMERRRFFSHGSEHSRGVMILVKENFDGELKVCHIDSDGRFIILRGEMQDHPLGHLH